MKFRGSPRCPFRALLACFAISSVVAGNAFCAVQAPAVQPKAPDTIAARVEACAECHGKQGEGTHNDYFPRLAGKPAGYLVEQLKNFRVGRRTYPPMNDLVAYLSDDYLDEIAVYYSTLRPPHAPFTPSISIALTPSRLARGQTLVREGDAEKGLPACAACHDQTLAGVQPSIPGLLGLSADYISAQLGAWRSGTRHAAAPDCMHIVAQRLSDADISAVAAWLSMQEYTPSLAPAPAGSSQLPLQCGSVPN